VNQPAVLSGSFHFLEVYRPAPKPRSSGITVASDQYLSLEEARSLISVFGPYFDWIKFPDHYGHIARYSPAWLKEKIALYHAADIRTTLGGVIYEVSVVQKQVERFFQRAAELGLSGVEISEDVIDAQSPSERAAHIQLAKSLGLNVFTEVGRKFPDKPFDAQEAADIAARDLEAGAFKVVVENSDIIQVIEQASDALHRFAQLLPAGRVVFEAGPNQKDKVAGWLLGEFGPEVNIENVDIRDVGAVSAMRAGLHRNVGLRFFDKANS